MPNEGKVDARLRLEGDAAKEYLYVKKYRGIMTDSDVLRFLVKSEYRRIKQVENRLPQQIPEHARKTILQIYDEDSDSLRAEGIENLTEFYNSLLDRGLDKFLEARKPKAP